MVLMLGVPSERPPSRRHNVSGRIDAAAVSHGPRKHLVVGCEAIICEGDRTKRLLEQFPCLYSIEQLEKKYAKEYLARRTRQIGAIDDVPDKILAGSVGGPIGIGKFIGCKHRVGGPRPSLAARAAKKNVLPFGGEAPIALIDLRGLGGREMAQNDRIPHDNTARFTGERSD